MGVACFAITTSGYLCLKNAFLFGRDALRLKHLAGVDASYGPTLRIALPDKVFAHPFRVGFSLLFRNYPSKSNLAHLSTRFHAVVFSEHSAANSSAFGEVVSEPLIACPKHFYKQSLVFVGFFDGHTANKYGMFKIIPAVFLNSGPEMWAAIIMFAFAIPSFRDIVRNADVALSVHLISMFV